MKKLDLTPLIKALEAMNQAETYEAQHAKLELILIEAELNPDPDAFVDFAISVEMLQPTLNRELTSWHEAKADFKPFFTTD